MIHSYPFRSCLIDRSFPIYGENNRCGFEGKLKLSL